MVPTQVTGPNMWKADGGDDDERYIIMIHNII
jgi:hypothetical protein